MGKHGPASRRTWNRESKTRYSNLTDQVRPPYSESGQTSGNQELMTTASSFWDRVQDELRTASGKARREAERAVRTGVLQMDLVSLRRDRRRAQADLGERALALWKAEKLEDLAGDSEALRLRTLVLSIEGLIAAKEEELRSIRSRVQGPGAAQPQ